ncbi:hypothetical protein BDZ97DRAFT_357600 [Flammula alnicola]|nr:hypothetical protein BDZ97DRAFT_357600 [Flammula alnicola]
MAASGLVVDLACDAMPHGVLDAYPGPRFLDQGRLDCSIGSPASPEPNNKGHSPPPPVQQPMSRARLSIARAACPYAPRDVVLDSRIVRNYGRFVRNGRLPNTVLRPVLCGRPGEEETTLGCGFFAICDWEAGEEIVPGCQRDDGNRDA